MDAWTNLSRRQAGLPPETELVEGVPPHLWGPLRNWVDPRFSHGKDSWWDQVELQAGISRYRRHGEDLLALVDLVLFWYPQLPPECCNGWAPSRYPSLRASWPDQVAELEQILASGRSAWRVNDRGDGLERRLEPTVTTAARQAMAVTTPATHDHLQAAWAAAYGRHPDPDKVFAEAIKAVEDVACPLVEPKKAASSQATLGTVIGELRNSGHRWELALPNKAGRPGDVACLIVMMELLWHAQVSRHGGAPKSRRQSQAEAEAAVQLAVTLTQWLSTGVLRRRAGS